MKFELLLNELDKNDQMINEAFFDRLFPKIINSIDYGERSILAGINFFKKIFKDKNADKSNVVKVLAKKIEKMDEVRKLNELNEWWLSASQLRYADEDMPQDPQKTQHQYNVEIENVENQAQSLIATLIEKTITAEIPVKQTILNHIVEKERKDKQIIDAFLSMRIGTIAEKVAFIMMLLTGKKLILDPEMQKVIDSPEYREKTKAYPGIKV